MRNFLSRLFSPPPFQQEAHTAYSVLVTRARDPFFYTECAVPDTLDGRFDVIVLQLFLVLSRLKDEADPRAALFSRALQEAFFTDMDRSIREMGVSDTGVGKRIKKMAEAFLGRLHAYEASKNDSALFREHLAKNLYRASAPGEATLPLALLQAIDARREALARLPLSAVLAGVV